MRLLLVPILGLVACGEPVKTGFEATIVGMSGVPFGLESTVAWESVSGSMSWHTANLDSDLSNEGGLYSHPGDGIFEVVLPNGVEILGTGHADVTLTGSITLGYSDGADRAGVGTGIFVDDEIDPTVELSILMTNATAVLKDDTLPTVFPDLEAKNWTTEILDENLDVVIPGNGGTTSFTLGDIDGAISLQFTSLSDLPAE